MLVHLFEPQPFFVFLKGRWQGGTGCLDQGVTIDPPLVSHEPPLGDLFEDRWREANPTKKEQAQPQPTTQSHNQNANYGLPQKEQTTTPPQQQKKLCSTRFYHRKNKQGSTDSQHPKKVILNLKPGYVKVASIKSYPLHS